MPAAPRRRWGLIVVVLLVDLGLAAAGAVMLGKGLAKTKADPAPGPGSAAATPAPPPASMAAGSSAPPPPAPPPAGSGSSASLDEPAPAPAPSKPTKTVAGRTPPHPVPQAAHAVASVPAQPVPAAAAALPPDPYTGGTDLDAEVARRVTAQQADLAKCKQDADRTAPVHGAIKVAFQVLATGAVVHAAAVENTTGSQALGSCLATVLGTWTFASHPGEPTNFVRPFAYP